MKIKPMLIQCSECTNILYFNNGEFKGEPTKSKITFCPYCGSRYDYPAYPISDNIRTQSYQSLFHDRILPALAKADESWPPYNSPHEGYAVLKEEVEELWMEVKMRSQSDERMLDELIDIAVVAFRFAHTITARQDVKQPLDNPTNPS